VRYEFVDCKTRAEALNACPWAAKIVKVEYGYICFESVADYQTWKRVIAEVYCSPSGGDGSENARLLAAAPELLAACREALESLKYDPSRIEIRQALLAAIEKATN
jgi:hypothetical protein